MIKKCLGLSPYCFMRILPAGKNKSFLAESGIITFHDDTTKVSEGKSISLVKYQTVLQDFKISNFFRIFSCY
jgi:predicted methyltransferase